MNSNTTGVNSGAPDRLAVPVPLVTLIPIKKRKFNSNQNDTPLFIKENIIITFILT